jgi:carbonic anhydrase
MGTIHNTQAIPKDINPAEAINILKKGNFRFVNNLKVNRNLLEQVNETKDSQWPFAAILSCMDSRTSAELVFDLGLGDIFSIRIAGNIITEGILGSLEYATAVVGSRLIVVLGHTGCGAIKGACDNVQMGNITTVLDKIQSSVRMENTVKDNRTSNNPEFVDAVAMLNVQNSVNKILEQSSIIKQLVDDGKVAILPAMYNVGTGMVTFFENDIKIASDKKEEIELAVVA